MRRRIHAVLVALVITAAGLTATSASATEAGGFSFSVDNVSSPAPGQVRFYGWAYDTDSQGPPIGIHVYVGDAADTVSYARVANVPRPDAHPYPHGFDFTLDVPLHGAQPVFIYAINDPGSFGGNALIWQGTVDIANPVPDTAITTGPPAQGTDASVTFDFTASEPSTFTCSWDQAAWQSCSSPLTATVAPGPHSFAVRATDLEGADDQTPATYDFTLAAPPVVEPPPPPPPPPTGTGAPTSVSLVLKAIRKKSKLKVDIGPDRDPSNYRFTVQKRRGKKWHSLGLTQTLGARDLMVLDLRRGRYRIVVPRQHGLAGATATARLRR